jgi:hypothetical protein
MVKLLRTSGLTLPSRGRATPGFASCRPPLMSNVSALTEGAKYVEPAHTLRGACAFFRRRCPTVRLPQTDPLLPVTSDCYWKPYY